MALLLFILPQDLVLPIHRMKLRDNAPERDVAKAELRERKEPRKENTAPTRQLYGGDWQQPPKPTPKPKKAIHMKHKTHR